MFFQEYRFCPPPCRKSTDGWAGPMSPPQRLRSRLGAAVPFVGDQRQAVDTPELHRLQFALPSAHGRPLGQPRAHVTQRKIAVFTDGDQTARPPSLQSAIVQPDSPNADDRQGIIDAAYGCLYEPHSGPIPVAAILERAGLSTRAFYRHFASKDELFLAMLRQEADALAGRLDRIAGELPGDPVEQLTAWVEMMFDLAYDPQLRMHLTVIDSDEVRAAKGYRETRERLHAERERSLERVLERGRDDGSFPLADPRSGRRRHQRGGQPRADIIGARQRRGSAARAGPRPRLRAAGVGRSQISR